MNASSFLVRALAIDRPRCGPVFAKGHLQIDEVREVFVRDGRERQNTGMADRFFERKPKSVGMPSGFSRLQTVTDSVF
jgi:hypothetical protein